MTNVSDNAAPQTSLEVYGARVNNLKNGDVTIPPNKLTVITGLSRKPSTAIREAQSAPPLRFTISFVCSTPAWPQP